MHIMPATKKMARNRAHKCEEQAYSKANGIDFE
jgi:hypothetical protein